MGVCAAAEEGSQLHFCDPQSRKVLDLVNSDTWQGLPITAVGLRLKLALMVEQAEAPPMKCISAVKLKSLGPRIPVFSEGHAVDAVEVCENYGVLIFVSHKWLQHGLPDDPTDTKAQLLVEWADWYASRYPARNVYFWIDWCCVDQEQPGPGIRSLPLYIGACTDLISIQMGPYRESAWCAVEKVLAFVLLFSGKVPWVIQPLEGTCDMRRTASGGSPTEEVVALMDPRCTRRVRVYAFFVFRCNTTTCALSLGVALRR